ncbi:hypothetical protein CCMA1212_006001, partial [Trichoderma ghanense]
AGLSPVRGAASTTARYRRQGLSNRPGLESPPRLFRKSLQQRGTPSAPLPQLAGGVGLGAFWTGTWAIGKPVKAPRRTRRKCRRALAFSGMECAAVHERFRVSTTPCICTYYRQATSLCRACWAAPSTCESMYVCAALKARTLRLLMCGMYFPRDNVGMRNTGGYL